MEKDIKITIASIKKSKEVQIDIGEKMEPQRGCCIYRVPRALRKINKEAYTPEVISIGPLHHRKPELADMEKQKIRYQREFSKRITGETWQDLINWIDKHEQSIRNCYEEKSKLKKFEFIRMILYDAIFIIELFLRDDDETSDFLLDKPQLKVVILSDLQLLENQLPFFVLNKLYRLAFPNAKTRAEGYPSFFDLSLGYPSFFDLSLGYPSFFDLSCAFFHFEKLSGNDVENKVKHFTDLRRYFMTKSFQVPKSRSFVTDLPCAVKLHESGVKFELDEEECSLDVKFVKIKRLWLGGYVLQIPRMEVYDDTELLIRNVMAWEQCHYPGDTHVCNFTVLLDSLVNTEKDLDLLEEAGIISSNLGDNTRVARTFNRLCLQINVSDSCYCGIVDALKAHYGNPWNHTRATLKSVYFSNLWRGTGTSVAFLLVLFTLIQTVCSILQIL